MLLVLNLIFHDTVNQIAAFWEVPYIDEEETVAKFLNERSGGTNENYR